MQQHRRTAIRMRRLDIHVRHMQRHALRSEVVLLDRRRIVEALQLGTVRGTGLSLRDCAAAATGLAALAWPSQAHIAGEAAKRGGHGGRTRAQRISRTSKEWRLEIHRRFLAKKKPGNHEARTIGDTLAARPSHDTSYKSAADSTTRRAIRCGTSRRQKADVLTKTTQFWHTYCDHLTSRSMCRGARMPAVARVDRGQGGACGPLARWQIARLQANRC